MTPGEVLHVLCVCFGVGMTVRRVEAKKGLKSLSVDGKDRQKEGPSLHCQVEESWFGGWL